ncbi:MAG: hypothetical protein Q8S73_03475 [Deltaproteobacteria bacterium]|nr:hypothetical protein [Myxococcales bacterium]MDP3213139.1 hypothetical protein [Deltaproteobacteria bacterium]
MNARWTTLALTAALAALGCASEITAVPRADAAASDIAAPDVTAAPDVIDAPDAPDVVDAPDVPVDVPAPRDLPPDDVDQACPNNATDRCLSFPPGPCSDLSDGRERVVSFAGFNQDHAPSCAGAMTSAGPDAVLPLIITQTSDVNIAAAPGPSDAVVVALHAADQCGDARQEILCVNGSNAIGAIATARASSLPPGRYTITVATARGLDVRLQTQVTAARPRLPGDLCPGIPVTADGPAVSVDTSRFATYSDYGTTCGYFSTRALGWADAVFSYTLTEARDVRIDVEGSAEEELYLEVSPVCGSTSQAVPGCDSGIPVGRTLRNQRPGTYYFTVEHHFEVRPAHTLTARVTTSAPTLPGPSSRCPGEPIAAEAGTSSADVDVLTPGPTLACLPRQRASAFWTLTAPGGDGDLLLNVASSALRGDAALQVRDACEGEPGFGCVGPEDRTARSVWTRLQGIEAGRRLVVHGATNASGGALTARWFRVPAATPTEVTGNVTCAAVARIPPEGGVFTGSTADATAVATPPCATTMSGCAGARGVLYRLDLPARRRVVAIERSGDFDTLLSLSGGMNCPGRSFGAICNDDWYSTDSQVEGVLEPGTYWIFVGGCGATQTGRYTLEVSVLPP